MFIPISSDFVPIDMDSLENETVVEARIFRSDTNSKEGSYFTQVDPNELTGNSLTVLPFCSIAEVRDLDAITTRLASMRERLIDLIKAQHWRLFIRFHIHSLEPSIVPDEVRELASTGLVLGTFPADMIDNGLVDNFRRAVATNWIGICSEIRLHEIVMREFGASTWTNVERYREMLRDRPDERVIRRHYLGVLHRLLQGLDFSDPTRMNIDLFSLGLINRTLDLGPLGPLLAFSPLKEQLRRIDLARANQLNRLEMLVDEGGAEWKRDYTTRHWKDERPIVSFESDSEEGTEVVSKPEKSKSNPYRQGLELFLTIEEKLGPAYVRLAGQIACAPARLLSQELLVQQLRAVDESAPWHPTTRLKRIADLSPEEISKIRATTPLPLKVVALFSIIDTPFPPYSQYACDFLEAMEVGK